VAAYFDLSFQHASGTVLRSMRRFGDADRFLDLLGQIRSHAPLAGVRSNVIVGFPGETDADLESLAAFLESARLDAVGVFGYSDEDGTEAFGYAGKLDEDEIAARVESLSRLVEELTSQRAEERIGERVDVLVEESDGAVADGRAEHQGPEVDGATVVKGLVSAARAGSMVSATVVDAHGVDLVAVDARCVDLVGAASQDIG
jgi:tRNA A37 methylthiotransferase MiaB